MADYYSTGTCKSCQYWRENLPVGECRRYPTSITTHFNYWCGEFEGKPEALRPHIPITAAEFPDIKIKAKRGRPKKGDINEI